MTLATVDLPDGLFKELRSAWEALMLRLEMHGDYSGGPQARTVHTGKPNLNNLPGGNTNIWLNLRAWRLNEEQSTFTADAYDSIWDIYILVQSDSQDPQSIDPFPGLQAAANTQQALRQDLADMDLDDSVSVQEVTDGEHDMDFTNDPALDMWRVSMTALHHLVNAKTT